MHLDLTRRDLLKGSIAAALATNPLFAQPEQPNLITKENALPGTRSWLLTKTHIDPATKYRSPRIEGYCDKTSVRAGDQIQFFISTNPRSDLTIDLYRTGYYQGRGARHLTTLGPFKGIPQPDPPIGERRLRECRWDPCTTFTIPNGWPSGVYIGKLTELTDKFQSYVIFIIRDDRRAEFIFQCSDTTWQSYNRWPSQFSLYDNGQTEWYWGPGIDISFDRPYGKYCQILDQPLSIGSGEYFLWEFPLAYWLEQHGYDVTYISNLDTHADPKGLLRAKAFLSVGHDEYYSLEMFNNLIRARDAGLNIAFLSGNTCCGRINPRPSSDDKPNRIFSRIDRFGLRENARFVAMDKLPHTSPNENTLIGARSTGEITGGADYTCLLPDHWLFNGTGMKKGDAIPGLVGWEWHGDPAPIPGLEIVASSMPTDGRGKNLAAYTSTVYPGPKRNLVFNAS